MIDQVAEDVQVEEPKLEEMRVLWDKLPAKDRTALASAIDLARGTYFLRVINPDDREQIKAYEREFDDNLNRSISKRGEDVRASLIDDQASPYNIYNKESITARLINYGRANPTDDEFMNLAYGKPPDEIPQP